MLLSPSLGQGHYLAMTNEQKKDYVTGESNHCPDQTSEAEGVYRIASASINLIFSRRWLRSWRVSVIWQTRLSNAVFLVVLVLKQKLIGSARW